MHEYTAQRLLGLLAGLSKRCLRLSERLGDASMDGLGPSEHRDEDIGDGHDDFSVDEMSTYYEFLRLLLQVCCH